MASRTRDNEADAPRTKIRISASQRQLLYELLAAHQTEPTSWYVPTVPYSQKTLGALIKLKLIERRSGDRYRITGVGIRLMQEMKIATVDI